MHIEVQLYSVLDKESLNSFLVIKFIVINKLVSLFESADKIRSYSTVLLGFKVYQLTGV